FLKWSSFHPLFKLTPILQRANYHKSCIKSHRVVEPMECISHCSAIFNLEQNEWRNRLVPDDINSCDFWRTFQNRRYFDQRCDFTQFFPKSTLSRISNICLVTKAITRLYEVVNRFPMILWLKLILECSCAFFL